MANIHRIEIDTATDPKELRKLFRKKLMTGGAVIRLKQGLAKEDLQQIRDRFAPHVQPHNLAAMVIREVERGGCSGN